MCQTKGGEGSNISKCTSFAKVHANLLEYTHRQLRPFEMFAFKA